MFDNDYDYEPYSDDLNEWETEQVFLDHEGDNDLDPAAREHLDEANGSDEDEWEDEFDPDESEDSWLDGSYEG